MTKRGRVEHIRALLNYQEHEPDPEKVKKAVYMLLDHYSREELLEIGEFINNKLNS